MEDLIAALKIIASYGDMAKEKYPTGCEHDTLYVYYPPRMVRDDDLKKLDDLGFVPDEGLDCFVSYRFGSA